jgi:hypothetical protein
MIHSSNVIRGSRRHVFARAVAATVLAGLLVTGCGDSAEEEAAAAKQVEKAAADTAARAVTDAQDAEAKKYAHMANAVVTSKSAAPVDLKYDLLAKPDVGQPFEIELTFQTRLPADSLEVEIL